MSERFNDGVIDLSQFRKKKEEEVQPFFQEPMEMELEGPDGLPVHFSLIMNVVHGDKQVLVLEEIDLETREMKETLVIVEGIIKDGVFQGIKAIEDEEEFEDVAGFISEIIESLAKEEEDEDDEPIN